MLGADDADEPKRARRKGMEGIDLMMLPRVKGDNAFWCAWSRVALVNVWNVRTMVRNDGRRMDIYPYLH
jgi:hypothetical protein